MDIHYSRTPRKDEVALAQPGWTMKVEQTQSGYHFGAVARDGVVMVRLSLNTHFETQAEAESALAVRAGAWIAEYLERTKGREVKQDEERGRVDGAGSGANG